MIIRKIRKIRTIKFLSVEEDVPDEYIGESFEVAEVNEDDGVSGFIDWLNGQGTEENPFILDPNSMGAYKVYEGWDIDAFDDSIAVTSKESVAQWLTQKLLLQYDELDYFYEDTSNVGIPYIDKKTKDELDLIIRNEILGTPGVREILSFSSVVEEREYRLGFSVKTIEGETVWLSIGA